MLTICCPPPLIPLGWGDTPWTGPLKLFKVFTFRLGNADSQLAYMLVYHMSELISAKIIGFPLLAYMTSCKDRCFALVPCWVTVCWNCCVAPVSSHNSSSERPVLPETQTPRARHLHLQTLASAGRINMFPDIYGAQLENNLKCFLFPFALSALKCLGRNGVCPAYKTVCPIPKHQSQLQNVCLLQPQHYPA